MKLKSIQIFPRGRAGWSSELLVFGEEITQIYGPNGSGKTPLVQSIPFCFGYPSIFRENIYQSCEYVNLTFAVGDRIFEAARVFSRDVDITLVEGADVQRFYDEREYSDFLFNLFEFDGDRNLITVGNAPVRPYFSSLLPLYYLDQDHGYSDLYAPPAAFIKDQHSEMTRIAFRLAAKHSYDHKKDRIEAKNRVDNLDRLVAERLGQLNVARSQLEIDDESVVMVLDEIASLEIQLDGFKSSNLTYSESTAAMQQVLNTQMRKLHDIDEELREISLRLDGKNRIADEINVEINTLSLNEGARRVFMSFEEICSSPVCSMFSKSSDSYSKNLLYLRDQIKDLDRNAAVELEREHRLKERRSSHLAEIESLKQSQVMASLNTESAALVEAISAVKNQIFTLQLKLGDRKKIEVLEKRYSESLINRENALDKYESFGIQSSFAPDIIRVRSELRKLIIQWLEILNTANVSLDISFKNDFAPVFGTENISQIKGSTKLRAVLAYHAAFLELVSRESGNFNLLILDTPKQHDINNEDLNNFVTALKQVASKYSIQVVFSSTEYHYDCDSRDAEWNPVYPGQKHKMFLNSNFVAVTKD